MTEETAKVKGGCCLWGGLGEQGTIIVSGEVFYYSLTFVIYVHILLDKI
jgi:hypothetical protein